MASTIVLIEDDEPLKIQHEPYVPVSSLDIATRKKLEEMASSKPKEEPEEEKEPEIVKSKVIVINSIKVIAEQDIEGNFTFEIHTEFANLSDGKPIEGIDITANEDIEFDDTLTLKKLNSIIRRCGILEKYQEYFVSDPDIIINSYELSVKKQYRFFEEFNDGIQTVSEIF